MRLFLTSYQKSGTHQIMQALMHGISNIVDQSGMQMKGLDKYGFTGERPVDTWKETAEQLREFAGKAFGHMPYLAQYAEALRAQPTKVLFNIRDPRDVVVSEYMALIRFDARKRETGHMNLVRPDGVRIMDGPDPIAELIEAAAIRWPNWLGWLDEEFTVVVRYEDLRLKTRATCIELQKALPGCYLPMLDDMVAQAGNARWSPTFRSGRVGDWHSKFEPHHKQLAQELLTPVIDRLGYVH